MTPECHLPEGFSAEAALRVGPNPEEIGIALKQITQMSDADRSAMGARGRNLVAKKFSWPLIGKQMLAVYEWMRGGGATPETIRLD
jgi:poly(glycerol-phosphate) alpha-glucosyltransferase